MDSGGFAMKKWARYLWLAAGLVLGIAAATLYHRSSQPAFAFNDRHEDYVMCTGQMSLGTNLQADTIWLLDYRAGKLLGTIVDKNLGRVLSWAEVDLVQHFNIPPKQNVHFMMTTGSMVRGQTVLYLTEINSGRFGIYSITPIPDGTGRFRIVQHDATLFRKPAANP
jgi:hypothetical protein